MSTDHAPGDMAKFPASTDLVVGEGTVLRTYPEYEKASLLESDIGYVNRILLRQYS